MKKSLLLIFIGLVLLFSFYGKYREVQAQEEKVISTVNTIKKAKGIISEWTIYYSEETELIKTLKEYRKMETSLKQDYPNFKWIEDDSKEHHIKITGSAVENVKEKELITLTAYKSGEGYKVLQTYSYTSKKWSENTYFDILQKLNNKKDVFFTVKAKLSDSGMTDLNEKANLLLDELSSVQVESLKEEDFVSISAFNDNWEYFLPTANHKKMNLQLALRKNVDESKINLTIGSPIITVEY
ncbi:MULTISPECIES: YwmB family TATA-box binding protein [Robertmurraya]|uniref:YwmB family TATA-box binding protein n=1 Tax=Robertmurraya beringensis TaxID=641660 RepID=A0ABV6KWJ4_9BACI